MNPYNHIEPNQPLMGTDAYYQQEHAKIAPTQPNYGSDMYAPSIPTEPQYNPQPQYQPQAYQQPQVYQQPQPQYQPQAPPQIIYQHTHVMVQNQLPAMPSNIFISGVPTQVTGRKPAAFFCQTCSKTQVSDTNYVVGNGGLMLFCGLFMFGCCICALFPFCTEDCQDAIHSCPQCRRQVGRNNYCS